MKKALKILLPLLFGIGILVYFLSGFTAEQYGEVKKSFLQANKFFIFLSVLLGLLSHLIRALRWEILLEPFAGKKIHKMNLILSVGISYLMNLGVPRSGEISRALVLVKYEKLPFARVMGTIVAERVIDMILLIFITLLTFWMEFDRIYILLQRYFPSVSFERIGTVIFVLLLIFLIFMFFLLRSGHSFSVKIKSFITQIFQGFFSLRKARRKGLFFMETLLIWGLYLLMLYVVMLAFKETSHLPVGAILSAFVAGSISIVLSNGGIGTYPVFVTEVLTLYGVSKEAGFAFSMTMWTAQTFILIVFGLFSFVMLPVLNRRFSKP